ncbi:hypothetical protein [Streptomyces sp. NRRL F-2580]|uniref:hypothetical protein n=1 Tax=Streptomyces sp. NRRL F-2580 TaxID=1463841 RepID=UPI0004CB63B7|nr:hypothetical protein [Streptomyces sp. NRRL F-2580]
MATPLVAGCVAVLRETLVKNGTPKPSAALIKAMLLNGADELPGQYVPSEAGASPNNSSGFGLVNLQRAVVLPTDAGRAGFTDAKELDQGEERAFLITVPEGAARTLKVTLVWTDPAGAALQNDLDLIVRAGDQERHGNMGTGPGFDRVNNVEQVHWRHPRRGGRGHRQRSPDHQVRPAIRRRLAHSLTRIGALSLPVRKGRDSGHGPGAIRPQVQDDRSIKDVGAWSRFSRVERLALPLPKTSSTLVGVGVRGLGRGRSVSGRQVSPSAVRGR